MSIQKFKVTGVLCLIPTKMADTIFLIKSDLEEMIKALDKEIIRVLEEERCQL